MESKLEGEFDEHVRASIQKFLTYFANPRNNTNVLRKKIAFHNDWEFVRQNVESLPGDAALFLYSEGTVGNTLFHFADLGVAFIMSNHVKPGDFEDGLGTITDEALDLARHLMRFASACLGVLLPRYVPMVADQVEVHTNCGPQDARIPFFMSRS